MEKIREAGRLIKRQDVMAVQIRLTGALPTTRFLFVPVIVLDDRGLMFPISNPNKPGVMADRRRKPV